VDTNFEGEVIPLANMKIGFLPQSRSSIRRDRARGRRGGHGRDLGREEAPGGVYAAYAEPDADFDKLAAEQAKLEAIVNAAHADSADLQLEVAADALRLPPGTRRSRRSRRREAPRGAVPASPFQADILLLDEPTNHLDAESVEWLEQFLRRFPAPWWR